MDWVFLLLAAILLAISCHLGYWEFFRRSDYFYPISFMVGSAITILWYTSVRYLDDKHRIYVFSMLWDVTMIAIFYLIPIMFYGVQLTRWGILGLFLVLVGVVILKIQG